MDKVLGRLRYSESLRFYIERISDRAKFVCSDYEQTICTRNELLQYVSFHINENDEAVELEIHEQKSL